MRIYKKTIFCLSIFLLIILASGFVSAHENTTDPVFEANDAIDDDLISQENDEVLTAGEHDFSEVQKSIDNAKPGSTIKVSGQYSGKNTITVTKSITIEGTKGGATFDGSKLTGEDGIITFYDKSNDDAEEYQPSKMVVTLKNLNFINFNNGYSAVYVFDLKGCNVINCTFTNCNSNKNIDDWLRGGALELDAETIKVTGCKFVNCSSEAGGALQTLGNFVIDSCEFINCSSDYGGAVYVGSGTIKNSNFTNNNAKISGGAISGETELLEINNCNFNSNHAKEFGGAIHLLTYDYEGNHKYNLIIKNSIFKDNKEDKQISSAGALSDFECYSTDGLFIYSSKTPKIQLENNTHLDSSSIKAQTINVEIKPAKLTTTYDSKKPFQISVKYNNKALKEVKLALKVYTGKKAKTYYVYTNSKGVASFKLASTLKVGTHKVEISSASKNIILSKKTSTIKVNKAKTIVKAPKVKAKAKKNKYFKITVKNKATKKAVNKLKLKVKVYTGKKAKTYTLKTNKKGVAKLKTKSLKKGSHKVAISSGDSNYIVSQKSKIVIK